MIEDDKEIHSGQQYDTNERGKMPPLVTTDFSVCDMGNASPRFIRCSTYAIPHTKELLDESKVCVFSFNLILSCPINC